MSFARNSVFGGVLALMSGVCGTAVLAQNAGFDPRENCSVILNRAGDADKMMLAAWTFGYIAATTDAPRPVDLQNNATLLGNLGQACQANPNASLLDLVNANKQPAQAQQAPAAQPGSEGEVRAMLMKFYAPNADHRALTQALVPTEQDIRAVYSDPLASALVASYRTQMTPDVFFTPKPEHNDILVFYGTTADLVQGKPLLAEFPGGYKDVVQYFRVNVPIVRFKFITKGETLGLAFDGLMHVNGRWVIMPKPWRALK